MDNFYSVTFCYRSYELHHIVFIIFCDFKFSLKLFSFSVQIRFKKKVEKRMNGYSFLFQSFYFLETVNITHIRYLQTMIKSCGYYHNIHKI